MGKYCAPPRKRIQVNRVTQPELFSMKNPKPSESAMSPFCHVPLLLSSQDRKRLPGSFDGVSGSATKNAEEPEKKEAMESPLTGIAIVGFSL